MNPSKTLQISRLSHQGDGIAFDDEQTWFVAGALPGERVVAQGINRRGRNVFARCTAVLEASPRRVPAPCALAASCAGCDLQHLSSADQRAHKTQALLDQLARLGQCELPGLTAEPITGPDWGYRERARFAVERQGDRVHLAYRAPASRSPLRIERCPMLDPRLESTLATLADWAGRCPPSLIQKELRVALGEDGRVGVAVDGRGQPAPLDGPVVDARGDALNDAEPLHYHSADGLRVCFSAADFTQVNGALNRRVAERLLDWLQPQGERVLELFCGIGNFSLPLAARALEVVAVDSQRAQLARAADNAARNALHNVRFEQANLYKRPRLAIDPLTPVLVDPPRAGLGELLPQLVKAQPPRIAYLSCDSASFAKDAGKLVRAGYALEQLSYVDFFAQTGKIESMGLFRRAG